jgi:choline-sulfatase
MNILFLMSDELSSWGLGCYGGIPKTPNLDALARRGVRFRSAYTPSPVCVSARAAIATGRHVNEIGCWSSAEAYDGTVPSWGHKLQAAGWDVASIGKLHYRSQDDATGFDEQILPIHIPNGVGWLPGLLRKPVCEFKGAAELAQTIGPGDSEYLRFDRAVTKEAERWLAAPRRRERPWCAFVSYFSPHFPLVAPEAYYRMYDPRAFEADAEPVPDHPTLREIAAFFCYDKPFDRASRGIARASYFALCSFMDEGVGRIVSALEAAGQAEDTVIVFTSDHGESLGYKGFWGKSTMYEDAAKVPLIVAGPGLGAGEVRDDPVSLIDIAPTICQAAGLADPASGFSGHSLLEAPAPERTVISEYHDGGASVGITMVRWNDGPDAWKYVHYAEGLPPQLFNLTRDPREARDLSRAAPEMVREGRRRLWEMFDPEAVNARAHADQARKIAALGGREKLLALPQWTHTPAESPGA